MKTAIEIRRLKKSITHHFLLRALHMFEGFSAFFLSMSLFGFILYLVGNFQSFLEETQLSILGIVQISGIIGFVVSLYYCIFLAIWLVRRKRLMISRISYGIVAVAVNLLLAGGSLLIIDLSRGIG